jgi:glycogen debranching enzyme
VLKAGELCLVTDQSGTVPADAPGMGLFYCDCRYLGRYALRLHGREPLLLASSAALGFAATVELTNPTLPGTDGQPVRADTLGILRRLVVLERDGALADSIRFHNFDARPIGLRFSLTFEARFEDVFALRGATPKHRGTLGRPEHLGDAVRFSYEAQMESSAVSTSASRSRRSWRRARPR